MAESFHHECARATIMWLSPQRPVAECPEEALPTRQRPYVLTCDEQGNPTGVQANRYEFWVYRQLRKRLKP